MKYRRAPRVFAYGLALALSACGGDDGGGGGGPSSTLVVTPQAINLAECRADTLVATVLDGDGNPVSAPVTFSSTVNSVTSVSPSGIVTANAVGTASIIVTSGSLKDTIPVTVTAAPNTLSLSPDSLAIFEGISRQLIPTFLDCHGVTPVGAVLTYQSSDPQVATFVSGLVDGVSPGSTVLTISDGTVSDTLDLVVKHVPVVVGSPTLTGRPFGVAASATKAYVTRLDDAAISDADLPSAVFDLVGFTVGSTPTDVAFSPSGLKAYVTNQGDGTIGVIDVVSAAQIDTIQTGTSPFRVIFNTVGDRAFVTTNANQVLVVNTTTDSIISTVSVGGTPNGLVLSNDNSLLYVSHTNGTIHVLNANTYVPVDTIALPGPLQDLGVSADGLTLYVADESGFLRFWNLAANNLALSIPMPAFGLKVSPNKELIYVAGSGTVTLIDASSLEVVNSLTVSGNARRIAIAPDGSVAFVANEGGFVSVIQ